jgi:CheY-like chemotaxis protein
MLDGQNILNCAEEESAGNIVAASFRETGEWPGRKTILLVEDEAFVRRVTAEVLDAAGYNLLIACDAGEAFEVVRGYSGNVDLLLADIVMPGMSGRELAVEFGRLYPGVRALLMSGYAEQFAQADRRCPEAYLAKPFSVGTLLETVRRLLNENAFACTPAA